MQIVDTSGMSREEWLKLRTQSIGASDAPVIAGLSKYKSRFQLWLEKTGQSEPEEAGEEAWWGTKLETLIEERLLAEHNRICEDRQLMIRDALCPWRTATLDMVDNEGFVWEFKAAGISTAKGLVDGDASTLPDAWILQAHHQMMCANTDSINFAVFVGHRLKLYRFNVAWSEEIGQELEQLESEFWQHVQDRTPPTEFDPQDAAVLLKHYRGIIGEEIVSDSPRLLDLAGQFEQAQAAAKFHSELADQCKAALLAEMKSAPSMRCGPYRMRRSTVNVKAQEPKPKAAYSYTKFTFTNTENPE